MSVPKVGADAPDLTPITSPVLISVPVRAQTYAVLANELSHKPPSLMLATPAMPPPPTPTLYTKLLPPSITPLYCPMPNDVTFINNKLGDSTRCSSFLYAELGLQHACTNIRGAPDLAILQPCAHLAAGMHRHFLDHGAPVIMNKSMDPKRTCAVIQYGFTSHLCEGGVVSTDRLGCHHCPPLVARPGSTRTLDNPIIPHSPGGPLPLANL